MDEEGDVSLPVRGGLRLKEVAMGGHIINYDSMIVLTHFKGHAMGGIWRLHEKHRHWLCFGTDR